MNIQLTRNYLTKLESELNEGALTQDALNVSMSLLYKLIEQLMDATFKTEDQTLKPMLAALENQARECLGEIKSKLVILN